MSIFDMLGGGFDPKNLGNMLSDPKKIEQFLPIISNIAESFKLKDENSIVAMVSIEENIPYLRVVATKVVKDTEGNDILALSRNIDNPQTGEPMKFNLIDLLKSQKIDEKT